MWHSALQYRRPNHFKLRSTAEILAYVLSTCASADGAQQIDAGASLLRLRLACSLIGLATDSLSCHNTNRNPNPSCLSTGTLRLLSDRATSGPDRATSGWLLFV